MSALLENSKRTEVPTTEEHAAQARAFVAHLHAAAGPIEDVQFAVEVDEESGRSVSAPLELSSIVRQVIEVISRGGTVTIGALPRELTTTTAAKMIGVSRPTLMQLINKGTFPAHKVGSHTRLFTKDIQEYKVQRQSARRQAFDELLAIEDELGIDD